MNFLSLFFILNTILIARSEVANKLENTDLKQYYDKCAAARFESLDEKVNTNFTFRYEDANWTVVRNDKYGLIFSINNDNNDSVNKSTITISGTSVSYELLDFYFRWNDQPSKENQTTKQAPLEINLIHQKGLGSAKDYQIISMPFVETSEENVPLNDLINALSTFSNASMKINNLNLTNILFPKPSNGEIFRHYVYERDGVKTECTIDAALNVWISSLKIGKEQLKKFLSILQNAAPSKITRHTDQKVQDTKVEAGTGTHTRTDTNVPTGTNGANGIFNINYLLVAFSFIVLLF